MKQMVPIQLSEEPSFLKAAPLGQVHTPVEVFIHAVVATTSGDKGAHHCPHCPAFKEEPDKEEWQDDEGGDKDRAIPPGHSDCFLVILINEVIGVISLEGLMVDDRMSLEGIAESSERLVHDMFVQDPFEKRRRACGAGNG